MSSCCSVKCSSGNLSLLIFERMHLHYYDNIIYHNILWDNLSSKKNVIVKDLRIIPKKAEIKSECAAELTLMGCWFHLN